MLSQSVSKDFVNYLRTEDQVGFHCPHCASFFRLSELELFCISDRKGDFLAEVRKMKKDFEEEKNKIIQNSVRHSRSAIMGEVFEQLSPFLPGFKYVPADLRHIGNPVDYISFNGLGLNREVESVTFLDIKAGKSARLLDVEESIRKAVLDGRVEFETIHFKPEMLDRGA